MSTQGTRSDGVEARRLRLVREEEGSPYPKASLFLRGGARMVDVLLAVGLFQATWPIAAVLVALLYVLLADGMFAGQSVGKRIFGVRVISLVTRTPARYRESVLRNAPFGLVLLFAMMPDLGTRAFWAGVAVIGGIEAFTVLRDALGIRLGDAWAQTQVVDGKVVAGQPALRAPTAARAPAGRIVRAQDRDGR